MSYFQSLVIYCKRKPQACFSACLFLSSFFSIHFQKVHFSSCSGPVCLVLLPTSYSCLVINVYVLSSSSCLNFLNFSILCFTFTFHFSFTSSKVILILIIVLLVIVRLRYIPLSTSYIYSIVYCRPLAIP